MLDHRIETFLTLCQEMNYRRTAQRLNMTQPAVTQHIHALEAHYGVKLFAYDGRTLNKTPEAQTLELRMRSLRAEEDDLLRQLGKPKPAMLRVGATKTIGEYVIAPLAARFVRETDGLLELTVENTAYLLSEIDAGRLDFALIEGAFDKARYDFMPLRSEEFVGICSPVHPFAGQEITLSDALGETLILRECGSGSRSILKQALAQRGYRTDSFARVISVNHFAVIRQFLHENLGIFFAYHSMLSGSPELASFRVRDMDIVHEFCYVYLNARIALSQLELFDPEIAARRVSSFVVCKQDEAMHRDTMLKK